MRIKLKIPTLQNIAHVVTIIGIILAVLNFWYLRKIESAKLLIEFDKQLRNGPTNSRILDVIADSKPLLKEHGGRFSVADVDRYLAELELLNNFYDHNLISEEMLYDTFSYDIEKAYCHKEIQQYLKNVRISENDPDIFLGFEELSKRFLAMGKCADQPSDPRKVKQSPHP